MSFLPNCTINIYKSSDTVNSVWIGTTDEYGKAIDLYGQPPNLRYGEYIAVAEHCDYNTEETIPFTVPETTVIPMSIGCTSSISTHETNYDHSKLATINTDILAGLIPTYSNFSVFPLPTNELTDNDYDDFTTIGTIVGGTSLITFDLGVLQYVSVIPYTLKYQLWGSWYSGSCPYSMFQVNVFNGITWIPLYNEQISPVCGVSGTTYYNSGVKTINGLFAIYDNISQIQIKLEAIPNGANNTANASISGTRIRAIG